jgi:hypothetical protein
MTGKLFAAALAAGLFVSAQAFAATSMTQPAPVHHAKPAPAALKARPHHPKPHKVSMLYRHGDRIGMRETAALNAVEAAGYTDVSSLGQSGRNVSVGVKKGNAVEHLTVTPAGKILPTA